jgi:hypothetical protein
VKASCDLKLDTPRVITSTSKSCGMLVAVRVLAFEVPTSLV